MSKGPLLRLVAPLLLAGCARATGPTQPPEPAPAPEVAVAEPAPTVEPEPEPAAEPEPAVEPELAPEPEPADPSARGPLTDAQVEILLQSAEDQAPDFRGGVTKEQENRHYLAGNEWTLEVYYPIVKDLGGGFVGVGTDQAYLFMTWAKPEIMWLVDYDPAVQEVHELYRLFFAAAETPEEFLALWDKPARDEALAVIDAAHDERRAKALRRWYLGYRGWIHRRLARVARHMEKVDVPTFLTDQEHYEFAQQMLEQRRVRPLLVNLLERKGLRGVSKASEELGVPIRLLYLSNAEEYWPRYPKLYREMMAAMPFTDDALVLRTLLIWKVNKDYRYNVQPVANYLQWLAKPYVDDVYDITHARPKAEPEGINFFETTGDPEDSPSAKRYRKGQAEANS
ncbi:MAG: hypothetical protein H6712_33090 [Myxococcales bacterium]|nr:hypothetical protein [Myxococcales bacterium]